MNVAVPALALATVEPTINARPSPPLTATEMLEPVLITFPPKSRNVAVRAGLIAEPDVTEIVEPADIFVAEPALIAIAAAVVAVPTPEPEVNRSL